MSTAPANNAGATALATTPQISATAISLGTLQATTPAALVQGATEMASTLADVIRSQHLAKHIQGREYVRVEGWTTLATMLGVTAREVCTTEEEGIYTATVELVRMNDGAVISRASAECGDESPWNRRPRYARRSMAQTRATGKACRLTFSWIMSLAGYEPTPAEEMQHEEWTDPTNGAQRPNAAPASPSPAPTSSPQTGRHSGAPSADTGISEAQHRRLEARINELGLDRERVKAWMRRAWGIEHFPDLPQRRYDELDKRMNFWAGQLNAQEAAAEREAIQKYG